MSSARLCKLIALTGLIAAVSIAEEKLPQPDAELVELGHTVYQQYCASCHGAQGEGAPDWKKRNERGELPPPPHDETGHTWRHSDAMLYRMISEGWQDPFNKTGHLTMPPFKDILTPHEIKAVIAYLKTLWTAEQRQFQREESQDQPFPSEVKGEDRQ